MIVYCIYTRYILRIHILFTFVRLLITDVQDILFSKRDMNRALHNSIDFIRKYLTNAYITMNLAD